MRVDDALIQTEKKPQAYKDIATHDICESPKISRASLCRWIAVQPQPTGAPQDQAGHGTVPVAGTTLGQRHFSGRVHWIRVGLVS
jgi:hypothetical protein